MADQPPAAKGHGTDSAVQLQLRDRIRDECARIEESARYSCQGQFEQAKTWRKVNTTLGILASCASALAAIFTFASGDGQLVAGVTAVAAALLTATYAALGPERRAAHMQAVANRYLAIQGDARRFMRVELPTLAVDDALARLQELAAELQEIHSDADPINKFAFRRAHANITAGGQTYAVDSSSDHGGSPA